MVLIVIDASRAYLLDYCGTAVFGDFPAALLDVADVERTSGEELYHKAEELGISLQRFVVLRPRLCVVRAAVRKRWNFSMGFFVHRFFVHSSSFVQAFRFDGRNKLE